MAKSLQTRTNSRRYRAAAGLLPLASALAGLMLLTGCNTDNRIVSYDPAPDYRKMHPIVLVQGEQTLDIFVNGGRGTIGSRQFADLSDFAAEHARYGQGPILISVPEGVAGARELAGSVRRSLGDAGVRVMTTGYVPQQQGAPAPVRLSFQRLKADVATQCGRWPSDLSGLGGTIEGFEVGYQQDFTFLPGWLQYFGVQANYTHLKSTLHYIVDPGSTVTPLRPVVIQDGPWTGASPNSFNATLYYEAPNFSARLSSSYRDEYITTYPIASGTCDPGFCDSPLVNDFIGSKKTFNLDGNFTYNLTDRIVASVEVLNITNQPDERWMYQNSRIVSQYQATGRQVFVGLRARF